VFQASDKQHSNHPNFLAKFGSKSNWNYVQSQNSTNVIVTLPLGVLTIFKTIHIVIFRKNDQNTWNFDWPKKLITKNEVF